MSESSSSVSYDYRLSMYDRESTMNRKIPQAKGAVMDVHLQVFNFSVTKIKTSDGQLVKLPDYGRISTPPVRVQLVISTLMLDDIPRFKRYILTKLANYNLRISTSHYFAKKLIRHITAAKVENLKPVKAFRIEGKLSVVREEVFEETHVLGRLKKEVPMLRCGDDDQLSCAVCLEELYGGSECTRTPCSHVFHYRCILPWLVKNKSCPICRRIVL